MLLYINWKYNLLKNWLHSIPLSRWNNLFFIIPCWIFGLLSLFEKISSMSWTSLYINLHGLIFLGCTLKSGNAGCELSKVLQGEKKKKNLRFLINTATLLSKKVSRLHSQEQCKSARFTTEPGNFLQVFSLSANRVPDFLPEASFF